LRQSEVTAKYQWAALDQISGDISLIAPVCIRTSPLLRADIAFGANTMMLQQICTAGEDSAALLA
jgi:hypothetical protein